MAADTVRMPPDEHSNRILDLTQLFPNMGDFRFNSLDVMNTCDITPIARR